ncbi:ester cyclase [Streptosporangium sp. NPDC048865]|uniref:ester cyclase n=1 Tax=Streptosporangium sp. NPDC048865 TaxID=3155766 RepID=UPI003430E951
MTHDDPREFYRHYLGLLNDRRLDELGELFHDTVTLNGRPISRDDVMAAMRYTATEAVPDLVWTVQDVVVEGDRLAARLIDTGTPVKEWLGIRPTGGSFEIDETAFYRVRDGRIEDMWFVVDTRTAQRQLDS